MKIELKFGPLTVKADAYYDQQSRDDMGRALNPVGPCVDNISIKDATGSDITDEINDVVDWDYLEEQLVLHCREVM